MSTRYVFVVCPMVYNIYVAYCFSHPIFNWYLMVNRTCSDLPTVMYKIKCCKISRGTEDYYSIILRARTIKWDTIFIDSLIYWFIYSFIFLFITIFIYSFIPLFLYSFIHSFIYSFFFIYSFIHFVFIFSSICFIHSVRLFIRSFVHLFIH